MKFTMKKIKSLIEEALDEPTTDNEWLDARYEEDIPIIGHTNPYYILFFLIAEFYKPKFVLELGSWRATAAAHFAGGSPDGHVVTIDIHKDNDHIAKAKTMEAAALFPNLTYINAWTWDSASRVQELMKEYGAGGIDILYMDAWHEYQYVTREWELYEPLLSDQALVICDDIFDAEGATVDMIKFWDELPGSKFTNGSLHPGIPMGFLRYIRKKVPVKKKVSSK